MTGLPVHPAPAVSARLRPAEAIGRTLAAAQSGDPAAMRLTALGAAAGLSGPVDWPTGLDWMRRAAEAGDDDAQTQLIVLSADTALRAELTALAHRGVPFPAQTWRRLAAGIDWRALTHPPQAAAVSTDPLVARLPGFLSPMACAWLCARGEPALQRAKILRQADQSLVVDPARTNSMTAVDLPTGGLVLLAIRQKTTALLGVQPNQLEPANLLHYAPGEQYAAHFDSFSAQEAAERGDGVGQRPFTLLVYLNAEFEGGETEFPRLGLRLRGAVGEAVLWRNTTPQGEVHPGALHAGLPPTRGRKWALSQWVGEKV
ncbi:MAG: hypothetical protein JWM33_825 [Caulobacteraceae bacterium]|nr:hypothetical protein [Caulobacteraceae bacterium]